MDNQEITAEYFMCWVTDGKRTANGKTAWDVIDPPSGQVDWDERVYHDKKGNPFVVFKRV